MISRIRALLSSVQIFQLDKRRAELAMAWAQRHPLAASVYNLGNYLFLGAIKAGSAVVRVVSGRVTGGAFETPAVSAGSILFRKLPARPRVLLIVEDSIPQCFEYRVQQKLDMLNILGWHSKWIPWSDTDQAHREIHFHDVILLYRVPGFPAVMSLIDYAISLKKLIIYDVDDLVFDRFQLEQKFHKERNKLSRKTYNDLLNGADLYKSAISSVPFCMVSTTPLQHEIEKVGAIEAWVLPNGVSSALSSTADQTTGWTAPGSTVDMIYGSGTRTHDADFISIAGALRQVLEKHKNSRLIIIGPVSLPGDLVNFEDRVVRVPFLEYCAYLEVLSCCSINIAPLEAGIFGDCKSEIKWMEAGLLGIPSVVSNTGTYADVIEQGVTGLLASSTGEWKSALTALIDDPGLRDSMGASAKRVITDEYGLDHLAGDFEKIIIQCSNLHLAKQTVTPEPDNRKRILFVNTLYPPQAMGGATRVVIDLIEGLNREHPNVYDIQVFTCDVSSTYPYRLWQYTHNGVLVTSLSVPMRPDFERQYSDDRVKEIFRKQLEYYRPDLVHFHSIQRLTASTLHAAEELGIPYVVTLHDAWWISDYSFMIDDKDRLLPANISNPLVLTGYTDDVNGTLARNRYLRARLNRAESLIAVSAYQANLYRKNSFPHLQIIENGVDKPEGYTKNDSKDLVIGYIGGKSVHKGYNFLRHNISQCALSNTRVKTIDLFSGSTNIRNQKWGNTPVEIYPRFEPDAIGGFYSMIDVLVVPSLVPESFGLAVREALLLGIWVVSSGTGGLAESVIHGETGFLFEAGNGQQFSEILFDLDQNCDRYKAPPDPVSIEKIRINPISESVLETHTLYQRVVAESA